MASSTRIIRARAFSAIYHVNVNGFAFVYEPRIAEFGGPDLTDGKVIAAIKRNDINLLEAMSLFIDRFSDIRRGFHIEDDFNFWSENTSRAGIKDDLENAIISDETRAKIIDLLNDGLPENYKYFKAHNVYGYVYLLIDNEDGLHKIGMSRNVKRRISEIEGSSLVYSFEADKMAEAEAKLHYRFSDKRVQGEWFDLDQKDIDHIKNITGYKDGNFVRGNQETNDADS